MLGSPESEVAEASLGPRKWQWGGCEIPGVEETPRNGGIGVTWVALGTQC